MSRQSKILAFITFATVGAFAASLAVLALGAAIFGPDFSQWAEWKGHMIGAVATVAGVGGAALGMRMAARASGFRF